MKTLPCERCDGTGRVPDDRELGRAMKKLRLSNRLTLREVARRLAVSAAYVCDLEHGRRAWHGAIRAAYLRAVKQMN